MKSASRTRLGVRAIAAFLALVFVFPPEAAARTACASFALLSLPRSWCSLATVATRMPVQHACCCALPTSASTPTTRSSGPTVEPGSDGGCCCPKKVTRDVTTPPSSDASSTHACTWIGERAHISARAVQLERAPAIEFLRWGRAGPMPPLELVGSGPGARSPAVGCARHDLLARGVVGLLTDFGTALL